MTTTWNTTSRRLARRSCCSTPAASSRWTSQPDLILLAIEDITERKQAEIAVQTSEVRYRRLFQTAKDGILILDANTLKIIDANPFMTELLGYEH